MIEIIQQAVHVHQYRVLVCAPSNVAVDNLVDKLATANHNLRQNNEKKNDDLRIKMIRLGHPARVQESNLSYSLDAQVARHEGTEIVQDIREELNAAQQQILVGRKGKKPGDYHPKNLWQEIKTLRREIRQRENQVTQTILKQTSVVFATNVGAGSRLLSSSSGEEALEFDLVIIDEAAQALEATCWIPILRGKRCVLAGDHCQLPPTVKSAKAKTGGLDITLFDRVRQKHPSTSVRMLTIQYRMHCDICNWSSKVMYSDQLTSHVSVANHQLVDLPHVRDYVEQRSISGKTKNAKEDIATDRSLSNATLIFLDTAGCIGFEEDQLHSVSKSNAGEVEIVKQHVKSLVENLGVRPQDIGIITPYNAQVDLMKSQLLPIFGDQLSIRSVDGFQGCEKEIVR